MDHSGVQSGFTEGQLFVEEVDGKAGQYHAGEGKDAGAREEGGIHPGIHQGAFRHYQID